MQLIQFLIRILNHPIVKTLAIIQFVIAIIIFYSAALMPFNDEPSSIPPWVLHLIGNILLALSASAAAYRFIRLRTIFFICCGLSLAAELSQLLTADRFADPADALTNIVGLLIGCAIATPLFIIKQRTDKNPAS